MKITLARVFGSEPCWKLWGNTQYMNEIWKCGIYSLITKWFECPWFNIGLGVSLKERRCKRGSIVTHWGHPWTNPTHHCIHQDELIARRDNNSARRGLGETGVMSVQLKGRLLRPGSGLKSADPSRFELQAIRGEIPRESGILLRSGWVLRRKERDALLR